MHPANSQEAGRLSGAFATVREFKPPDWYPNALQGSARFVGRLRGLWEVHTALNPVGISEHEYAYAVLQLRGMGGVGKSLLATEYAKRFGAAYPGGIHWLRGYGFDPKPMDPRRASTNSSYRSRTLRYNTMPIRDKNRTKDFLEIRLDLGRKLASGSPYLWVVDDLPARLDQEREFPKWCAPTANGCTLITTRSKDYEGIGSTIPVDVLEPQPALQLLTQERKPQSEGEKEDAEKLAEDLGRHALAFDLAGHFLLRTRHFAELRHELAGDFTGGGSDPLRELAADLRGQLPSGQEKSIVATLTKSVRLLGEEGLSLLRLACVLHGDTPIPLRLASEVFKLAFALEDEAAKDYLARAVNQSETHSLATISARFAACRGNGGGSKLAAAAAARGVE